KEPKVAAVKEPPPREKKASKLSAASKDDDDFAPVKKKDAAAAAKSDAPSSGQALAAYKAKDFATAERLYRLEASKQSGQQMDKPIAYANDVRTLRMAVEKAGADETKNASAAIADYEQALGIDARIGKSQHAAYFKQRIGKLQIPVAQQAFAQGKY